MSALRHYLNFARYNRWANTRVYNAVQKLSDDERKYDRGMFFQSFSGTLNHLLVTDYMWMHRITKEGLMPTALNEILHEDFSDLLKARDAEDQRIIDYVGGLQNEDFGVEYTYSTVSYGDFTSVLSDMLAHIFNHQTHHRGQIHNCLSQMGAKPEPLDYMLFLREEGG